MSALRLDAGDTTLVVGADGTVLHWGAALPPDEDTGALAMAAHRPLGEAMLDINPAAASYPGLGWMGPAPVVVEGAPAWWQALDAQTFEGPAGRVSVDWSVQGPAIVARSTLTAAGIARVDFLAGPMIALPHAVTEILDFTGRWCGEFRPQRHRLGAGAWLREAREGRPGHGAPPVVFLMSEGATDRSGDVWAVSLGWSGGHRIMVETLPDGRRVLLAGALGAQDTAVTGAPPLVLVHSGAGLNGAMGAFHDWLRIHGLSWPDPARPRPLHYNCWEAVYFDHDIPTLKDIATRAAALGAERFVLDDGWFLRRGDDRAGLGDWTPDPDKYPDGLHGLIDHIHAEGMYFGLWVEPEMVNPDSDLHRAHPEWVLGPADQPAGRHQLVLDLARPDMREAIFAALDTLLRDYPIDYLKWDHNRQAIGATPAQGHGIYALLDRLRAAHPRVEIESCASGGARIDHGILARTHRVWLSDSNDALERLRMQHEAALMIPPEITGSHVGPRLCHTSGRRLPMAFRAWVAAQRHMGFEMDPRELSDDEAAVLTRVAGWWKDNRDWLMSGRLHRLMNDGATIAEMTVAAAGECFAVFAGQAAVAPAPVLRLSGLERTARYRVTVANRPDLEGRVRGRDRGGLWDAPQIVLSGAALMETGLALPILFPETMLVLQGERL